MSQIGKKNVGSHLLRDEIRKKQMVREMAPESDD